MNGPNKLGCYITVGWKNIKHTRDEHSSLLVLFICYKEREVLLNTAPGLKFKY
jgi:hypothetical protein